MSQNKTKFQGMDTDDSPRYQHAQEQFADGFNTGRAGKRPGTVVRGVNDNASDNSSSTSETASPKSKQAIGKPVVGFLYSVSRTMAGEYWPVHIGGNTIGNDPDCDIVLGEATVSGKHATLQVRRDRKTNHVSAWVIDSTSTNGTMVNDITLSTQPVECKNGDIITCGDNYEFYFVLIDAAQVGLKVNEDFISLQEGYQEDEPIFGPEPGPAPKSGTVPRPKPFSTRNTGTAPDYTPTDGTIGTDGSSPMGNRGGTKAATETM